MAGWGGMSDMGASAKIGTIAFDSIDKWKPAIGDVITRHRIFSWWGFIDSVDSAKGIIRVIRAANPQTLFTMGALEQSKRATELDLIEIRQSKGYAVNQVKNGQTVWYIS